MLFNVCAHSIVSHLSGIARPILAHHDGPNPGGYEASPVPLTFSEARAGVGSAKNVLLRALLTVDPPLDWIFLSEDDVAVDSPMAVLGYLEAASESGWDHLSFHAHGFWSDPVEVDGAVTSWANYCGAWAMFSRRSLETVGLFDEAFVNAFEHPELTLRLAAHGFTPGWRKCADATDSEHWLHEQPGAHDQSIIARLPDTGRNAELGREHWKRAHPETWPAELG
ncbi:MAG: hypothetical protein V4472_25150 [Pseudomonadota bacterium]